MYKKCSVVTFLLKKISVMYLKTYENILTNAISMFKAQVEINRDLKG